MPSFSCQTKFIWFKFKKNQIKEYFYSIILFLPFVLLFIRHFDDFPSVFWMCLCVFVSMANVCFVFLHKFQFLFLNYLISPARMWVKRRLWKQWRVVSFVCVVSLYFNILLHGSLSYWLNICCFFVCLFVCFVFCIQMDRREEGRVTNKRVFLSFFFFLLLITEVILLFHLLICLCSMYVCVFFFVFICVCVKMFRWDMRLFSTKRKKKTSLIIF